MASTPNSRLHIRGLKKRIGTFTLHADFQIAAEERVAIVGRSGSGKTTLLRLIAGLEKLEPPKDSGEIWIGDVNVTEFAPECRQVGMVFQDQALFPSLNILENAAFGLRMKGVSKEERANLALEWLDRVGLKSLAHASILQLSGGERQRVAFIRAVLWKPEILLLDEPFSALDVALRQSLRRELVELHRLWPVPLLLVTHDPVDVEAIATSEVRYEEDPSSQIRKFTRSPI